ncbi:MAG TPA: TRAP transporter small permease, partial [Alphaproteobacteria bacterium]|jgi:TRAP-type C4-dicarboxylate transport system permease small subunit|nr:TRAP transporter small permease [Alphaproteobacteria bacterium]
VIERLDRLALLVGAVLMALLALLIFAQVVLRYLFAFTPVWSEELGRYLLIWAVLAGSAVSVRGARHIRVEFLAELLPPRVKRAWYLFLDLVILGLFVLLVATGIEAVGFNYSMRSLGLQVRLSYVMAGIPLFFGIAALFLIDELRRRGKRR